LRVIDFEARETLFRGGGFVKESGKCDTHSMKRATERELAAILWKFCTQGMDEFREKIGLRVPGYEKQTLFGPSSRLFESASLHLCLAMAAVSQEAGLQGRIFDTCIDYIRELGGTMFEIHKFLAIVGERKIDYMAAMQRRQEGDEAAFSEEVVEHLVFGGAEDSKDEDFLLLSDCDEHVDSFLPRCVELRSEYDLIPG
jgi:hypothetical protein